MIKKALSVLVITAVVLPQLYAQFSLSAEIRPRTEYRDGFKTPNQTGDEAAFFTEQRSRLNFNFSDSTYSFRLSLQDVRIWGENNQIFKQEDGNTFLSESWFQFKLVDDWTVKMGRQIISYDNQRYFGGLEWAQQGRRHDALLLIHENKEKDYRLDFGLAFNADDDVPEPQNIQSPTASFYSRNNYKNMQYLWFHKKFSRLKLSLLAVNLGYQTNENSVTYRQTFGTHGKTKGNFGLGWDFYYQSGKQGASTVSAYLAGLNLTYRTDLSPITLGVEYISGKDDSDTSSDVKHFSPDFGTNHTHNGYMDYFFVGPSNGTVGVMDVYLKTKFKLNKGQLHLHAHQFFTGSEQLDLNNEVLAKAMGSEIDLVYSVAIYKDINLKVGYSFLLASDTMQNLRNRDGDFNSWGWIMFTVKPELWSNKES